MSPYVTHLLTLTSIYSILGISLNLAMGYTGLLNLGHVAFFAIGAYTAALLTTAGISYLPAMFAAGVLSALAGMLLISTTRRLSGDYLALATLGFTFVIHSILLNWREFTRGPLGIPGIPEPSIAGYVIPSNQHYAIYAVALASLAMLTVWRLVASPYGKVLESIRDDHHASLALGKNVFKLKLQSMITSAFLAGIAGSLFAHYISYIEPANFFISEIIIVLSIVMIGGLASIKGTIAGTVLVMLIPELLRFTSLPPSALGPLRQIIYATLLLGVIMLRPRGIFGRVDLQ